MRRAALVLCALLTCLRAGAEVTAPPPAPPETQTTVRGVAPDLLGRWLGVGRAELPDKKIRSIPFLWDIALEEGQLAHTIRFVIPPESINAGMREANKAGRPWAPSREDLAALKTGWDGLEPWIRGVPTRIETEITGRDGFDEDLKNDPRARDALWVLREVVSYPPYSAQAAPATQTNTFAALAASETGYTGNYTTSVLAFAPIPVTLTGTFEVYRLDDRPARGIVGRILDVFRGCGR